uniref:Uncharacterized protein n=1 Tax=Rhizophora mucronata TaxID=61149 RepID=A0A2P2NSU1_RHIMU
MRQWSFLARVGFRVSQQNLSKEL